MKLAKCYENGRLTLGLIGELDHHSAGRVMDSIAREMEEALPRETILDLSGLTFMDSSGIALILKAYKITRAQGGTLALASPTRQVQRVMETSGIQRIVPTLEPAGKE